jgi:ankyrin repeat protein
MHLAVNIRNAEWVETLLEKWYTILNLAIKNEKGFTPYEYAKHLGFGSIADLFEEEYTKVTTANGRDSNGLTGLMLTVMRNDLEALKTMATNKQSLNLISNDRYRNTALHIALAYQNIEAVRILVAQGADVNVRNARGESPVHFLIRAGDPSKQQQAAILLLEKSPQSILAQDDRGNNLLHYVVQYDTMGLLDYLFKQHKPEVQKALNVRNKALQTPINLANTLNRTAMLPLFDQAVENVKPRTAFATPPEYKNGTKKTNL